MSAKRPHVLLLVTDQQRGDCLGIEDHPVLQTPAMDEIGATGARFRRAYAECPQCIPARRTLMSGQDPATHGMLQNHPDTEWDPPATLAGELRAAGYETLLSGKLHLSPEAEALWVRPDVDCRQHARRRQRLPGLAARGDSAQSLGDGARGDAERVDRAAESLAGGADARVLVCLGGHQLPAAEGSERAVFPEGVVYRSASAVHAAAVLLRPL